VHGQIDDLHGEHRRRFYGVAIRKILAIPAGRLRFYVQYFNKRNYYFELKGKKMAKGKVTFEEGFEVYGFQGRGHQSPDFVLFAPKTMTLCFSAVVMNKLGMADWDTCLIAYNTNTKAIALKSCDPAEYGCRKLSPINTNSQSRRINIKGLIKFYNAEEDTTRRYRPEMRRGGMLVLTPETGESDD
jgi:hypothetical protein